MGASGTFQGECFFCAHTSSVRLVNLNTTGVKPGQPVQSCFECRPAGAVAPEVRSYAVLVGRIAYLLKATCRAEAEGLLDDELHAVNEPPDTRIEWGAENTIAWRAAWRRKDVVIVEDRKLPGDLV